MGRGILKSQSFYFENFSRYPSVLIIRYAMEVDYLMFFLTLVIRRSGYQNDRILCIPFT